MNKTELARYNIAQNLDDIMNLDPRGYGVCRILYDAAREYTKKPLTLNAAVKLTETLHENDTVFILTGFILLPHKQPETDGIISSVLLARALVKAFSAKPVIICPEECLEAVKKLSIVAGLHLYLSFEELLKHPKSMAVIPFTKNTEDASDCADRIISDFSPKAVISIECPGANETGVYHNASGLDVSRLEAKSDMLFAKLVNKGVLNIAIGDLGNETGMGTIIKQIRKYIPHAGYKNPCDCGCLPYSSSCVCGCGKGISAKSISDNIITATVSDWGCYALIAMLAFLFGDTDIMLSAETERRALLAANEAGCVDMNGDLIPYIDGMSDEMNAAIVKLMYLTVENALKYRNNFGSWYEEVIKLGYFE